MSFEKNPTIIEIKGNIKSLKALLNSPVRFFLKKDKRKELKDEISDLEIKLDKQIKASNRYNELFSEKGWIVHESLDVNISIKAVETFDSDGIDAAEDLIKSYYQEQFHNLKNIILNSKHFQSRKRLFELAYEDYQEERYHSSIPLMLMLVDGVLNDLHQKGFAVSGEDYELWDSISGHSSGLNVIAKIYNKTVRKTNEEMLELPHRHGILHGRELNYDNKTLAIKTNALVIYIFDWIRSYESEGFRKEEYEKRNNCQFTFKDYLDKKRKMSESNQLQQQWENVKISEVTYTKSQFSELIEGTPEYEFMNFIKNLNARRYGLNYRYIPVIARAGNTENFLAGQLRKSYEEFLPIIVEELHIQNRGSATSTIRASLKYRSPFSSEEFTSRKISFNFVYQDENGKPENRLKNNGQWIIMGIFEIEFAMR